MKKTRIVERMNCGGNIEYVIQQKHFLFRWWWVDARVNSDNFVWCDDSFSTREEAEDNLKYFQ